MIPPDVASALRSLAPDQNNTQNQRTQPVGTAQPITDVLSNLLPGQRIMAEIQALLPNGSYRALVAQREVTLALPFSAKPGDSLELEVQENQGRTTLAFIAEREPSVPIKGQPPSATTQLSTTGKLIGNLLQGIGDEGKRAPPAPLNGNQALIDIMPMEATQLAPLLKQALSQSGMFYEAHQARWVAGKLPTELLRHEPQGKLSAPQAAPASGSFAFGWVAKTLSAQAAPQLQPPLGLYPLPPSLVAAVQNPAMDLDIENGRPLTLSEAAPVEVETRTVQSAPPPPPPQETDAKTRLSHSPNQSGEQTPGHNGSFSTIAPSSAGKSAESPLPPSASVPSGSSTHHEQTTTVSHSAGSGIPREITSLVQQQLDGLANQSFLWQGQIWPGQQMWWEIAGDTKNAENTNNESTSQWRTRLRVDLPALGGIEANLTLQSGNLLSLRVDAADPSTQTILQGKVRDLERALLEAGLSLRHVTVNHESNAQE